MSGEAAPVIDLPYTKRTLDNGLDVIVHEDHHVPIVAVNLWYHVGSKNEQPGRTGFAHLFEHLMFEGSANHDSGYFAPLISTQVAMTSMRCAGCVRSSPFVVMPSGQ